MTDRVLALLGPALEPPGAVLLDATLGRAGHASALLGQHPGLALIGVDTDDAAIEASRALLARTWSGSPWSMRCTTRSRRSWPGSACRAVHGILFDLGVSSPQLDDPARGFAYS